MLKTMAQAALSLAHPVDLTSAAAADCAAIGDIEVALFLMKRMRQAGRPMDDACLDPFFAPDKTAPQAPEDLSCFAPRPHRRPRWQTYQQKTQEKHTVAYPIASCGMPESSGDSQSSYQNCPKLTGATSKGCGTSGGQEKQEEEDTATSFPHWGNVLAASSSISRGWESLPSEILQRIVESVGPKELINACAVCPNWGEGIEGSTQFLSLAWCKSRSVDPLLQSLLPKFKSLLGINLRRCSHLSDSGLSAVCALGPQLQSLLLCMSLKVTDRALLRVGMACTSLQVLDLSGCQGITETGVAGIARGCIKLRELSLCGCVNAGTDRALQSLARSCPSLEVINLGWCDRVGDSGVTALAAGCPGLRAVDLCGCTKITDAAVLALASQCWSLQGLDLHCCRRITDVSIVALNELALATQTGQGKQRWGKQGTRETLSLPPAPSSCWGDFHTVLHRSLPPLPSGLVSLNVSGCLSLRPLAVQALCSNSPHLHTCPKLRSLNISGCMALLNVHCRCMAERR